MAEARAFSPPLRDWTLLPFEATSLAPAWIGAGIALSYVLLGGVATEVLGIDLGFRSQGIPFYRDELFYIEIINGLIFAYLPTANAYTRRGALRDLRELRPVLRCNDAEFEALLTRTACVDLRTLTAAGMALGAVFATLTFTDPAFWIFGRPSATSPVFVWVLLRFSLTGWLAGHAIATEVHVTRCFLDIGGRLTEIDLLDLRPLRPFASKSLRCALTWILLSSLISLYWLTPGAGQSNPFILGTTLAGVAAGVVFPVLGVHRRIRALKTAELDRVRGEIRHERERTLEGRDPSGGRLADLLAYRQLVEHVREWPFDTPALLRVALYASLGIGSWLGGALVERFVDTVLR